MVIFPLIVPAYFNVAAPPGLLLLTLVLARAVSAAGTDLGTRTLIGCTLTWFILTAAYVSRASITHHGITPVEISGVAVRVDGAFAEEVAWIRRQVEELSLESDDVLAFPVPTYYIVTGQSPWYPVDHITSFLTPSEVRELPQILESQGVRALIAFDSRSGPIGLESLAPALIKEYEFFREYGRASIWMRRTRL